MNNTNHSSIESVQEEVDRETLVVNPDSPIEHFPDPAARATPHKLKPGEEVETLELPEDPLPVHHGNSNNK